ncbi:uncharacterized protein LOC129589808 [Paramacrobiotus metropolitanus]|uniref:uncharacterized protein LOC129589808 n=1 Tax=Paramacrobiotus metropolitanus TaxID=2943436 RepID=UPI002445F225|nr:uncharacterized protein LOC129589808 [Paramacrobiotus metropolitanus]
MLNHYQLNSSRCRSVLFIWLSFIVTPVFGTLRYYGSYLSYGSGDTIISTFHAHQGKSATDRKWHVECLDGEAMIGLQDWFNDFQKIESVWCRFIFPFKPPTNGMYPYYPQCFPRNYTSQFFCFDPQQIQRTVNSFITGLWDDDFQFFVSRTRLDDTQLYKCCRVPPGYYIDYVSCYYMPTHDQYWEYYDSLQHAIVYCASGYVMTGISKKINPFDEEYHIEWIQCCRIGFGGAGKMPPPTRIQRSVDTEDEDIDLHQDALATLRLPKNYSAFFRQPTNKLLPESDEYLFDGFSISPRVIL